jgi:hypothetical protein
MCSLLTWNWPILPTWFTFLIILVRKTFEPPEFRTLKLSNDNIDFTLCYIRYPCSFDKNDKIVSKNCQTLNSFRLNRMIFFFFFPQTTFKEFTIIHIFHARFQSNSIVLFLLIRSVWILNNLWHFVCVYIHKMYISCVIHILLYVVYSVNWWIWCLNIHKKALSGHDLQNEDTKKKRSVLSFKRSFFLVFFSY